MTAPVPAAASQRAAAASPGSDRVPAGRGLPGRTAYVVCPWARRARKCAAVGAVSMMGRPAQGTKAATSRAAQTIEVAAVPRMPAISMDGMNTAAAAAMHAIRAAEKPRRSPRDDRRPNRTRFAGAAWAVLVMAFAL